MPRRFSYLALVALVAWASQGSDAAAAPSPYPSTPYALDDAPTAVYLPYAFGGPSEWGDPIWVAMRGRALALTPRPDGSLIRREETTLPADVAPTAIASSGDLDFYLDAAHGQVLVYRADGPRRAPVRTLAVGPEPAGIVAGSRSPEGSYVMAANAGRGDLSMYRSKRGFAFGAERRIKVGARPSAILLLDIDETIAVANTGSGTVSEFNSPESFDGFGRLPDVMVGGTPSALAVADSLTSDLNDDVVDDLVVGDATQGIVTQLLSLERSPWFTRGPVFPTGPVDALAVANLDRDGHPDLALSDRGGGRVLVLRGTRSNGLGAPTVAVSSIDPAAVVAGQFGGDYQHDLLVADARSRSVRLLLTPGDRLLSSGRPARNVAAGSHGRLFWSQASSRRRHRLVMWIAGTTRRLPIPPSVQPIVPRRSRSKGHAAVSYVRCRNHRCRPFVWDLVTEREDPIQLARIRGCTVRDVAMWNRTSAFVLAARRGCPRRARGLWLHRRPRAPRRLSALGEIGALRGRSLAFIALPRSSDRWRIRLTGRMRPLDRRGSFVRSDLSPPTVDGKYAYWTERARERLVLVRGRVDRRTACWEYWPSRRSEATGLNGHGTFEPAPDFAVAGDRLFYADNVGTFEADPDRIRWHRSCRR